MPDCECLPGCPVANDQMPNVTSEAAAAFTAEYCRGDNADCARHMVKEALGGSNVPPDMLPDQVDCANALIASG